MPMPQPVDPPLTSEFAADPEMRDLVAYFVQALPERVDAMRAALAESRLRDLQRLAHQLKGAAGGYGYPSLGSAAGALESSIRDAGTPSLPQIQEQLDELVALCGRAIAGGR